MKVKDLKGKFLATAVLSDLALSYEDRPILIERLRSFYESIGFDIEIDLRKDLVYPVGFRLARFRYTGIPDYHRLPKLERVRTGTIVFRSTNYEFTWINSQGQEQTSHGTKPLSDSMRENGFFVRMFDGHTITYTLTRG